MNLDWFSSLSSEQNDTIIKIFELEEKIKTEKNMDNKAKIEKLANDERRKLLSPNVHLSYQMLASRNKTSANNLRSFWQENSLLIDFNENLKEWKLDNFFKTNFIKPELNLTVLPVYSFIIQFAFTLVKPYISRDEQEFYIIDNPIRKDKIFSLPIVAPSSWKGSFRSALWHLGHKSGEEDIRLIFGNEKSTEEHERLRAGRLSFFPTFFSRKSLEIINPHDRERRVGTIPILMETVPKDTLGMFTILYVPFDLIGKDENKTKEQAWKHLKLVCEGLKSMFLYYGFGAKTSSGHGIVKPDLVDGKLILNAKGLTMDMKKSDKFQEPEEAFKKYLKDDGNVKDDFKGDGEAGLLSNSKYGAIGRQLSGGSQKEFVRFRTWYKNYGLEWQKFVKGKTAIEPVFPTWTFASFDELEKLSLQIERKRSGEPQ